MTKIIISIFALLIFCTNVVNAEEHSATIVLKCIANDEGACIVRVKFSDGDKFREKLNNCSYYIGEYQTLFRVLFNPVQLNHLSSRYLQGTLNDFLIEIRGLHPDESYRITYSCTGR